jgi:glycosidase
MSWQFVAKLHIQSKGPRLTAGALAAARVALWRQRLGRRGAALAAGAGLWAALAATPAGAQLRLHVPSPDWRDQILYFVMTDRFADGDPANNDQGAGEHRPGDRTRYQGGDFQGLIQRLDYIRGLGATALWITPPVANQWLAPDGVYSGYHGYWAQHFKQVDPHLGTLADYQRLSDALHRRGLYLVQDIVVNHTGNFFGYGTRWRADDPRRAWRGWEGYDRTAPVPRPSQSPFDRNDPRDPAQRAEGIYHWTPDVADYTNPVQEETFQMAGLDDLATGNPAVRRALRDSYGYWVREVGVDAFRVDTAFYVPPAFFRDFLRSGDPAAPGIERVARATGREGFFTFGEGFGIDKPFRDEQARKIDRWLRDRQGPLMPGMLNFPLYGAFGDAFARGRPPAELAHRIRQTMALHARPHLMPTFVDNHDVDRFLKGGTVPGLRQALLAMMTLPGVPVLYYGTEQGFTEPRASMFAAGWGSGGRDRYDTEAPLYRDIAAMAVLRRGDRVFTRGTPRVLHAEGAAPGAIAWVMEHTEGGVRRRALVALNTAEHAALLPAVATGWPAGTVLEGLYGLDGLPARAVVGAGGRLTLPLAARSGQVWRVAAAGGPAPASPAAAAVAAPRLQPLPDARVRGDFTVHGQLPPGPARDWRLVVDGQLAGAPPLQPDANGRFSARVDTSAMVDPAAEHQLSVWADGAPAAVPLRFRVDRAWTLAAQADDPAGDDRGALGPHAGRYLYPTDPSWGDNRQMDLRAVAVHTAGGALRIDIGLHRLTTLWNPANGFDHVHLTVFIELPGEGPGATVMPLQDGALQDFPELQGMTWHRRLRVGGWSNALFSHEGADATREGTPVAPGAALRVDAARHTLSLTLPAAALGRKASLAGARVWVATWDYDAGYRALAPEPGAFAMGGAPAGSPKVMDASAVLRLR